MTPTRAKTHLNEPSWTYTTPAGCVQLVLRRRDDDDPRSDIWLVKVTSGRHSVPLTVTALEEDLATADPESVDPPARIAVVVRSIAAALEREERWLFEVLAACERPGPAAPVPSRRVTILAEHGFGTARPRVVILPWVCPECGGPRGEPRRERARNRRRTVEYDAWSNPCGHTDTRAALLREADAFAGRSA